MTTTSEPDPLSHDHVFLGDDHDRNARRTLWVVALTAAAMVGEVAGGLITGSMALLADGVHMATHAGALGLAAAAYAMARRYAHDRRFCLGTGKVDDLAGFASALLLGASALGIAAESLSRLWAPTAVNTGPAILMAVIGLAVNLASAAILGGHGHHGGHHHHHDHHHDHDHHHHHGQGVRVRGNNNLRCAYLHVLADALTSVLAIGAVIGARMLGWEWLDPAMGLVGATIIAQWSRRLLRDTSAVLLDLSDPEFLDEVRRRVEAGGAARVQDLHVWRVGPEAHAAIVSVTGGLNAAEVRRRLRSVHRLAHVTVEAS